LEVALVAPGYRVSQVFLDREDTAVTWFSKKFKWTTVAKELVVRGTLGPSHLPLQATAGAKHPLLDLADIFVWSIGRSFSDRPIKFIDFKADVQTVMFGPRGDELVIGGGHVEAPQP
jgi:hypothetical protein